MYPYAMKHRPLTIAVAAFKPRSVKDEVAILRSDIKNFRATRLYLRPLIDQVLIRSKLAKEVQANLRATLDRDVTLAAQRFLSAREKKRYRFSTYFTWYIKTRLEQAAKLDKAA